MKPYLASLINAIVLIGLGLYGYFTSDNPSATAFIPVGAGAVILVLNPIFKKGNKVVAHIVVVLTFLLVIALVKPLTAAISSDATDRIIRVVIMMAFTVLALVVFVKSFIDARRNPA